MPEADTMHPRNNHYLRIAPTLLLLLTVGSILPAQQAPAPLPPEQQLPLNVDRDPVPSPGPMPGEKAPAPQPGQVTRKNGGYTLTRDVDEVILSATVVDDHARVING